MASYKQLYALEMSYILLLLKFFFIEVDCKGNNTIKIHMESTMHNIDYIF